MGHTVLSGFITYQIVLMAGVGDVLSVVWNNSMAIFSVSSEMAPQSSVERWIDCVPLSGFNPSV